MSYYSVDDTKSLEDTMFDAQSFTEHENTKKDKIIILSETKEAGKM
jgi:hypothetical protein